MKEVSCGKPAKEGKPKEEFNPRDNFEGPEKFPTDPKMRISKSLIQKMINRRGDLMFVRLGNLDPHIRGIEINLAQVRKNHFSRGAKKLRIAK